MGRQGTAPPFFWVIVGLITVTGTGRGDATRKHVGPKPGEKPSPSAPSDKPDSSYRGLFQSSGAPLAPMQGMRDIARGEGSLFGKKQRLAQKEDASIMRAALSTKKIPYPNEEATRTAFEEKLNAFRDVYGTGASDEYARADMLKSALQGLFQSKAFFSDESTRGHKTFYFPTPSRYSLDKIKVTYNKAAGTTLFFLGWGGSGPTYSLTYDPEKKSVAFAANTRLIENYHQPVGSSTGNPTNHFVDEQSR